MSYKCNVIMFVLITSRLSNMIQEKFEISARFGKKKIINACKTFVEAEFE